MLFWLVAVLEFVLLLLLWFCKHEQKHKLVSAVMNFYACEHSFNYEA
jgi:hypothetical protein